MLLFFGAVAFRGAPYVPTLRRGVNSAMDLLDLHKGDLIVDLGSGDGKVLKAAAARGYKALGYEINPILYLISKLRTVGQRHLITVRLHDFWLTEWPPETKAIFVFLAGPHMNHLARRLGEEMGRRREPLIVLSYGYTIPGYLPKRLSEGVYIYELQPTTDPHKPQWNERKTHEA